MDTTTEQVLREALEFYANLDHWTDLGLHSSILIDGGRIARAALVRVGNHPEVKTNPDFLIRELQEQVTDLQSRVKQLEQKQKSQDDFEDWKTTR